MPRERIYLADVLPLLEPGLTFKHRGPPRQSAGNRMTFINALSGAFSIENRLMNREPYIDSIRLSDGVDVFEVGQNDDGHWTVHLKRGRGRPARVRGAELKARYRLMLPNARQAKTYLTAPDSRPDRAERVTALSAGRYWVKLTESVGAPWLRQLELHEQDGELALVLRVGDGVRRVVAWRDFVDGHVASGDFVKHVLGAAYGLSRARVHVSMSKARIENRE
jgi:hypothetical protein